MKANTTVKVGDKVKTGLGISTYRVVRFVGKNTVVLENVMTESISHEWTGNLVVVA